MTCHGCWVNACGCVSCTTGLGIGTAASGLFKAVGCIVDTSWNNKSQQKIASGQNANQQIIAQLLNQTNTQIAQGNNATQNTVAGINADAEIKSAEIQAAALAAQKQPINSSTIAMIFVGTLMLASVIGIFYLGKKK